MTTKNQKVAIIILRIIGLQFLFDVYMTLLYMPSYVVSWGTGGKSSPAIVVGAMSMVLRGFSYLVAGIVCLGFSRPIARRVCRGLDDEAADSASVAKDGGISPISAP